MLEIITPPDGIPKISPTCFCVKPSFQDLDGKGCPVIHPSKNCFDLPRVCNL
jgi:hypothetical protein